jgi:uncharacterized protein (TIGR00661 family)
MKKAVFIVQGEGRGHLSQALAMMELCVEAGIQVSKVFVGKGKGKVLPAYFTEKMGPDLVEFQSPYFLRTPNRKGIYIGRTLLYHALLSLRYFREAKRLRREITAEAPQLVINFYELVGSLAMRRLPPQIRRMGIGHHFLLHLERYPCGSGKAIHRSLLSLHTRMVLKACDQVLALSFRNREGRGKIRVVPPLVRREFRDSAWSRGSFVLIYLLNEGYIADILQVARRHPEERFEVFSALPPATRVPPGITLHAFDGPLFRERMLRCRSLVSTAGFETLAEAATLGIPLAVVPVRNHFEQGCNSQDLEKSGLGRAFARMNEEALLWEGEAPDPAFRTWVEQAGEIITKFITE